MAIPVDSNSLFTAQYLCNKLESLYFNIFSINLILNISLFLCKYHYFKWHNLLTHFTTNHVPGIYANIYLHLMYPLALFRA